VGVGVSLGDVVGDGAADVVVEDVAVEGWSPAGTVTDERVADVPSPPEHPETSATARSADVQHAAAAAPRDARAHRMRTPPLLAETLRWAVRPHDRNSVRGRRRHDARSRRR
jgi:hypothetical protein